jgi:hypothetical protein
MRTDAELELIADRLGDLQALSADEVSRRVLDACPGFTEDDVARLAAFALKMGAWCLKTEAYHRRPGATITESVKPINARACKTLGVVMG